MTSVLERGTRIGQVRVRVRGADRDACAARCAVALPGLDLEPATMPPQTILCVRSLADPLPGGIDARSRHAQIRPLAWEAAMRVSLRETLHRAVRPMHEPVPPSGDAVVFQDLSELLACAARDACRGALSSCWWWRHLLPSASFDRVVGAWRSEPTYVPAALELLVHEGSALPFVRRLSRDDAAGLLDVVLRAHALPSMANSLASIWSPSMTPAARRVVEPARAVPLPADSARQPGPVAAVAPWRAFVPADWERTDLALESYAFAALTFVLRRAPSLSRQRAFEIAVVAHLRGMAGTVQEGPADDPVRAPIALATSVDRGKGASSGDSPDRARETRERDAGFIC